LEWYLNTAQFGPYIYGADAAARAFFGRPATELSLAQAALLAAAAEAPGIHPFDAPQVVAERQQQVLQSMLIQGRITSDDLFRASQEKVNVLAPVPLEDTSPAFTKLALEQLSEAIPLEEITRGGYRIITTLDDDLQTQSDCATNALLRRLSASTPETTEVTCAAVRLLPTLAAIQGNIPAGTLSAALIALDPKTGQVLSMVGTDTPGLNPARLPGHPPGTLMTPLVYLTAFTRGFSPGSLFWDIPNQANQGNSQDPSIDYHGPLRLRTALVNDYLGPAIQLFDQLGQDNVLRTARQLGITSLDFLEKTSPTVYGLSAFMEERQIKLLEAVQAYGIFANQGIAAGWASSLVERGDTGRILPAAILRVETSREETVLDWSKPQNRPVLSAQLAYLMTQVLSDETARWPSLGHPNPLEIGRPAAAKIGTTETGVEWTVGYTPQLVIGTWLGPTGGTDAKPPPDVSAALWHAEIQYAMRAYPSETWDPPAGVSTIEVCDPSGLLPTPDCPTIVPEVFINGTEPTQADNLYQKLEINRETGRLATVFTPAELITERVYLVVPPEAVEWAQKSNLPLPPQDYDVIFTSNEHYDFARIIEPQIFAHVHGQVVFQGSASGDNFQFYRMQVGQGVNPREWLQVGPDHDKPIENGILETWDTQELSGLYSIQLLVVRKDQRVERVVTQVTIDNTPPEVSILAPGHEIPTAKPQSSLLIRVKAEDNLELAQVEFYIDDRLAVVLVNPPFVYPWKTVTGEHRLRIVAVDLAGNQSEDALNMVIK